MIDYDSHYELPGGGTVSIDYGDLTDEERAEAVSILSSAVGQVRGGYNEE